MGTARRGGIKTYLIAMVMSLPWNIAYAGNAGACHIHPPSSDQTPVPFGTYSSLETCEIERRRFFAAEGRCHCSVGRIQWDSPSLFREAPYAERPRFPADEGNRF